MYMFIIAFAIVSSSKFSSKTRINKEKVLVQPKPKQDKINKKVKTKGTINNFSIVEGLYYYPLIDFNEIKKKDNFSNFHFKGKKEIFPIAKGIVLFVGKEKDLPGYTVIIHHSCGYISLYSNLEEVKIIKGDLIRNIFEPIGISDKILTFSLKKNFKEKTIENIDLKKFLKKRDNYNKT